MEDDASSAKGFANGNHGPPDTPPIVEDSLPLRTSSSRRMTHSGSLGFQSRPKYPGSVPSPSLRAKSASSHPHSVPHQSSPDLRKSSRSSWSVRKLKDWLGGSMPARGEPTFPNPEYLRPCGLPPKTEKEAREHARKVEELRRDRIRLEKKKEDAEARRQKRLVEKDAFMQKARDIWTTQVIPDWETQHKTKPVRKLWLQGIPDSVRKDVWPLAIENALKMTPELFEILKDKAQEARKNRPPLSPLTSSSSSSFSDENMAASNADERIDVDGRMDASALVMSTGTCSPASGSMCAGAIAGSDSAASDAPLSRSSSCASIPQSSPFDGGTSSNSPVDISAAQCSPESKVEGPRASPRATGEPLSKENTASLIQLDLRRTFPQLQFYQEGPEHDNLYMVLDCYVHYRPDIGYVQGMTYLAAILLLYMDCYTAFVCLVNMLSKYHFLSFFRMDLKEMNVHLLTFDMLMKDQLPVIHERFRQENLRVEFFCIDWFVTLYSKSLPLDIAARVWDLFFMDSDYLYLVGLGILKFYNNSFANSEFEEMFEFITHLPKRMDEDAFFHIVTSFDVSKSRLKLIKQEAKQNATERIG